MIEKLYVLDENVIVKKVEEIIKVNTIDKVKNTKESKVTTKITRYVLDESDPDLLNKLVSFCKGRYTTDYHNKNEYLTYDDVSRLIHSKTIYDRPIYKIDDTQDNGVDCYFRSAYNNRWEGDFYPEGEGYFPRLYCMYEVMEDFVENFNGVLPIKVLTDVTDD